MIYVQHLLGIGHLQRAALLATALDQRGFQVDLLSGGMPSSLELPDSVKLSQLAPVRSADASFSRLLDQSGDTVDDDWHRQRVRRLLQLFSDLPPDVLITETFPFGRRMMRFELLPLLDAARASSHCRLIVSSIRDILQPKTRAGREAEICDWVDQYYDRILVHGDLRLASLEQSFAAAVSLADKLSYTGYICRRVENVTTDGTDEVLVSAGGSDTGLKILHTALAARPLSSLARLHWRLLVSPAIARADFETLVQTAGSGISVERNRPDFASLLENARLSISQAGYNTIAELLGSQTPAVVIPYAEAAEIEQTMRADLLAQKGRLVTLAEAEMTATTMASAVDEALTLSSGLEVSLDGAQKSALLIENWLSQRESN